MAKTEVLEYPRTITKLIEKTTPWYDGRDAPDTELVVRKELVYTKAEWVVRECLSCSREFHQHWREWNEW